MSSNRLRILLVSVLAMFAIGAVASASASAFNHPLWHKGGAAIATGTKVKVIDNSLTSRLWTNGLGLVIVCKKDVSKGTIENHENAAKEIEGIDEDSVTYEGCAGWSTKENAAGQIVQKEELTACTVSGGGGGAGVIIVPTTKSFLAYLPEHEPGNAGKLPVEVVDVFEPKVAGEPFVKIAVSGASCAIKVTEENGKVLGGVIGKIPRVETAASGNEEAILGEVMFETRNAPAAKKVEQHSSKKYELNKVTHEEFLTYDAKEAALEGTEQVELESFEPFGVNENK